MKNGGREWRREGRKKRKNEVEKKGRRIRGIK